MKRFFTSLIVIGVVISAATGFLVFQQTDRKMYKAFNEIENIDWIIPLDSSYSSIDKISKDEDTSWYLATKTVNNSEELTYEILDNNFKKQMVYNDYDLFAYGSGYIETIGGGIIGRDTMRGLMDYTGKEILPPRYINISIPKDGYLAAIYFKNKGKPSVVFFNEEGKRLFYEDKIKVTDTTSIINAGNGIFAIISGGDESRATIYDAKSKSIIKVLDDVFIIHDLENGFYATEPATGDTPVNIYDSSFNYIKTLPENYFAPQCFSDGIALLNKISHHKDEAPYTCIDEDFNVLFDIFADQTVIDFSDGKSICYNKDSFFCIDSSGNVLYEKPLTKPFKNITLFTLYDCKYKNGKGIVYDGTGYGIVDENGNWIVEPVFNLLSHGPGDTFIATTDNLAVGVFRLKN